jgi:tetratricopeptide (TPR) repeat protein
MSRITPTHVRRLLAAANKRQPESRLLKLLASAVDHASDLADEEGLQLAAAAIEAVQGSDVTPSTAATLHYFHANAWAALRHLRHRDLAAAWTWESAEHEREILSLRRAIAHPGFTELGRAMRCRVYTNLANVLDNIGRFINAIEYYDRALNLDPDFGMALGNKGMCMMVYAREHFEPGHRHIFVGSAERLLEKALGCFLEAPDAREGFARHLEIARRTYAGHSCASSDTLHRHKLGTTPQEEGFRSWCLRHRLFVNPLNDLGPVAIAGWDYLILPTMTVLAKHGTGFHGLYNQLKQEYAAARWLYYEATELPAPVFVDRQLNLLDTRDHSAFGIKIEKLKLAMRAGHSLFDKLATFVDHYLGLGSGRAHFRWFWYKGGDKKQRLRSEFAGRQNLALRALFWLSKDLADSREHDDHVVSLEPDAREIANIRNHLEHGYVKVHSSTDIWLPNAEHVPPDPLAYRITEADLQAKTLRVLKMARSALIYLCLAVHREECGKAQLESAKVHRAALKPIP